LSVKYLFDTDHLTLWDQGDVRVVQRLAILNERNHIGRIEQHGYNRVGAKRVGHRRPNGQPPSRDARRLPHLRRADS
jgi:hypothetical protein